MKRFTRMAAGFLLMAAAARAETRTWVGIGNWSDGANWSGGVVPGATDDVVFDATSTANATVDAPFGGSVASVTVTAGYTGLITQNRDLAVSGAFTLSGGTWRYTAGTAAELTVGGSMTVNGVVQCQRSATTGNGTGRTFTVGGDLTVGVGGVFDATDMGFNALEGPGAAVKGRQGGGGHGGEGGTWGTYTGDVGRCYGSIRTPTALGSGGASGPGGGAIRLIVTGHAQIDGVVKADTSDSSSTGRGAGGSVWLTAATLAGGGLISADGGGGGTYLTYGYGHGGGGRVAVHLASGESFGNVEVRAITRRQGANATHRGGGAGSVYLQKASQTRGTCIYDNHGTINVWRSVINASVTDRDVGDFILRGATTVLVLEFGETLPVYGSWSNAATFTAVRDGTVSLEGAADATVWGSTAFGRFAVAVPGKNVFFETGKTFTVNDLLTFTGASGDPLTLRPTGTSQWNLKLQNAALPHSVRHVDVAWSHAGTGATVPALDSTDAGDNVNWSFAAEGQTNVWTGVAGTAWADTANWSLGRLPISPDVVVIPDTVSNPVLDFDKALLGLVIETDAALSLAGKNLLVTGGLTVNGTLTASGSERIEVWGDVDLTGGLFQNASTTFVLGGPGPQTITSGALAGFNRLDLVNTGGTLTFSDAARATNLVAFAGVVAAFGNGLTCVQTLDNQAGAALTFGGTVEAGSLLNATGDLTFGGAVTCGVFRNSNADLTFADAVTCGEFRSDGTDTLTFAPGAAVAVSSLWLNGTPDASLLLRSATPGSRWLLTVVRVSGAMYVDVRDSDASGGLAVEPILSTDSGNNLNWDFSDTANWAHWTGAVSTDFMAAGNWDPTAVPGSGSLLLIDGYLTRAPRLLTASTVTVARVSLGGHQPVSLTADGALTVIGDLHIIPNGLLTHTAHPTTATTPLYALHVTVSNDLFVAGAIDVNGKGYAADKGPGAGLFTQAAGGYGGAGGEWQTPGQGGKCYGSITQPVDPGSGGDNGPGGGVIRLRVGGRTTVDGVITANGKDLTGSGAGSGGSVWIETGTLAGSGLIAADGGRGGTWSTWGYAHGGGGRVAVSLTAGDNFGDAEIRAISHRGVASANHRGGGAGSVYLRKAPQAHGVCIYDNYGTINVWRSVIDQDAVDPTVGDFVLRGATTILYLTNQTLAVHGDWTNAAAFSAATNGTVAFAGTGTSAVMGDTAFGGLECVTPGKAVAFEAGKTFTVGGMLRLRNAAVRSTGEGVSASLTLDPVTGLQDIRAVSVRDSDASGGQTLLALPHSTDLGNTLNWAFIPSPGTLLLLR